MYGTMYGMVKTTVYLTEGLKQALEIAASASSRSEADLMREGIERVTAVGKASSKPKLPLCSAAGDPHYAERVDEELEGFGLI